MVTFAYLFIALMFLILLFHVTLIFGAPLGDLTMGGKYPGKLPIKIRVASFIQILVVILFSFIIISRTGIYFESYYAISRVAVWIVVSFFIFGTLVNILSPSKKEKLIMGPLNIIALICSLLVAIT